MSKKYTKQNIRKRKKDRTTKRKKHKRIGGLRRMKSWKSLKQLNSNSLNSQIEFKTCNKNKNITDNCVGKNLLIGTINYIMFNLEKYERTDIKFKGGYGTVRIFKSNENKLAVKTFGRNKQDFNEEKNIAKIINKLLVNTDEDRFGVVPTYYHDKLKIIIMHYKNFDINKLLEDAYIPNLQKIKIYKDVVKCIKNLALEGLFYGDLKFKNVLIQGTFSGPYKVYLGDIGSIAYIPNLIGKDIKEEETISKQIVFTIPYKDIKGENIDHLHFDDDVLSEETNIRLLRAFFHQILSFLVMLIFHNTIDITLFYFNNKNWILIKEMKDYIMEQVQNKKIVTETDTETLSCKSLFENFFFPDPDTFKKEWKRRLMIAKHDNDVEEKQNLEGEIRKQAIKSILEDFEALNIYIPLYEDEG